MFDLDGWQARTAKFVIFLLSFACAVYTSNSNEDKCFPCLLSRWSKHSVISQVQIFFPLTLVGRIMLNCGGKIGAYCTDCTKLPTKSVLCFLQYKDKEP